MAIEHWVNVAIAGIGMVGALAAGAIGYQSGSNAVNKDYVSLAISTLDKKDASPELRKWSVDVLSELSPVPFNSKLREELTKGGLGRQRFVYVPVTIPKFATEQCPDIINKFPRDIGNIELKRLIVEYEICRNKFSEFLKYIGEHNKIMADGNAEQKKIDDDFMRRIGIAPETPSEFASPTN